ncbi:MAG: hypothetical protein HUU54_05640 [Ignavibacteriaceae bacterium]|nr:hypothetical protein [Ignavibacteriaceae bacterium]
MKKLSTKLPQNNSVSDVKSEIIKKLETWSQQSDNPVFAKIKEEFSEYLNLFSEDDLRIYEDPILRSVDNEYLVLLADYYEKKTTLDKLTEIVESQQKRLLKLSEFKLMALQRLDFPRTYFNVSFPFAAANIYPLIAPFLKAIVENKSEAKEIIELYSDQMFLLQLPRNWVEDLVELNNSNREAITLARNIYSDPESCYKCLREENHHPAIVLFAKLCDLFHFAKAA